MMSLLTFKFDKLDKTNYFYLHIVIRVYNYIRLAMTNHIGGLGMPLMLAPLNKEIKIVKILLEDKTKKHLESLGILAGSSLVVISSINGGVVVKVKEGRLALDRSIASKILVA